jgi:heme o synthase
MLKDFFSLTKLGIVIFALVSALAGYAVSLDIHQPFDPWTLGLLIVGLYLVAAGSFAFNQAQEWRLDAKMPRTQGRPIPRGAMSAWQAYVAGVLMMVFGLLALRLIGPWPAGLALVSVLLYNGTYTLFWKRRWMFAAVPGAIPGAMPVVIGFSVNSPNIFRPECLYLFLVMFLWQMPHFWALAIRFREDYKAGGIPVLPVSLGVPRTLLHIGLYLFAYVGVALSAPWFLQTHVLYVLLVLPISAKVVWEFFKYFDRREVRGAWLPFFLWTNFSLLVYLAAPVMDKWLQFMIFGYV